MKPKLNNSASWLATGMLVGSMAWAGSAPAIAQQTEAEQDRRLETVVVQSTKRETTLQDAPISIGVVTGETIDEYNITDLSDLQGFVPSLVVQKTFGNWAVRIRGLGSGVTNIAFDSSVSIFNDGIYCGRSRCLASGFLDIGSVEIARGPQGALFGKSTIAGAITVASARPTETYEGYVTAGLELEDGGYRVGGAVSGPLSDTMRARLALQYVDLDGDLRNAFTGQDENAVEDWAARASVEWDLTPDTQLFAKIEAASSDITGGRGQLVGAGALRAPTSPVAPGNIETRPDQVRYAWTGISHGDFDTSDQLSFTGQLSSMVAGHSLELIAGISEIDSENYLDVDGVPERLLNTGIFEEYEQKSLEARLLSPSGGTFEYIVGALYHSSLTKTGQYSPFYPDFYRTAGAPAFLIATIPGATGSLRSFKRDTDTVSVYGQLTWNPTDRLSVIGDIRYTDEEQNGLARNQHAVFPDLETLTFRPGAPFQAGSPEFIFYQTRADDSLDPSIRLLYAVTDDINVYAAYSTGSKPGGLKANDGALGAVLRSRSADFLQQYVGQSVVSVADLNTGLVLAQGNGVFDFEDENAENFEIGTKMVLADGTVTLNAAAFSMKFDNLQTSSYDGTRFIIGNAASADVTGLELEGQWLATENLRLTGAASFIDATYDEFLNAQCPIGSDGQKEDSACVDGQGDLSGRQIERSPEVELNLGGEWTSMITPGLRLTAAADGYYSSAYFVRQDFDPLGKQDAFTKINARIALGAEDDRWQIALVGRNITDELTIQHAYEVLSDFQALSDGRKIFLEGTLRW